MPLEWRQFMPDPERRLDVEMTVAPAAEFNRQTEAVIAYAKRQQQLAEARDKAAQQRQQGIVDINEWVAQYNRMDHRAGYAGWPGTQRGLIAAAERANELLQASLSPTQREQLSQHGWFEVRGSLGGRYRIEAGYYSGNVMRLDSLGRRVRSYCAHGAVPLPVPDHILLQKLTLESDEQAFLDVAY